MKKLRIFLADDHAVIREGLKLLVNAQPDMEVIGEAGNGKDAVQKARELKPDVVVMDVSMPELNGVQATERLKQARPDVKVVALTVHEDENYLRQLLKAGASGYVLKRAAADELTRAIRTVAEGGVYLDPTLAGKVVDGYVRKPSSESDSSASYHSDREAEVLRLIAWGYSNKEIAAQLHLSVKTIETYKTRLMEKLNLHSRADIVRYALRQGWLQEDEG
jgi:DNA-binding NarL/FixJ family response regulator